MKRSTFQQFGKSYLYLVCFQCSIKCYLLNPEPLTSSVFSELFQLSPLVYHPQLSVYAKFMQSQAILFKLPYIRKAWRCQECKEASLNEQRTEERQKLHGRYVKHSPMKLASSDSLFLSCGFWINRIFSYPTTHFFGLRSQFEQKKLCKFKLLIIVYFYD